jgi:hypothetical protein
MPAHIEKRKENGTGEGSEIAGFIDVAKGRIPKSDKDVGDLFLGQGDFFSQVIEAEKREDFPDPVGDMDERKRAAPVPHHVPQLNQDEHTEVVHISHFSEIHSERDWGRGVNKRPEVTQHGPGIGGIHPACKVKDQPSFAVV